MCTSNQAIFRNHVEYGLYQILDRLQLYQSAEFKSGRWETLAENTTTGNHLISIRVHSLFGIGERLHTPLKQIFNEI